MDEYMDIFRKYIGKDRKTYTKTMFKIMGTIYRGATKGRFTLDEGMEALSNFNNKMKKIHQS